MVHVIKNSSPPYGLSLGEATKMVRGVFKFHTSQNFGYELLLVFCCIWSQKKMGLEKKKKKKGSQIASQMLAGIQNLSLVDSPVVYTVFFNC